MGTDLGKRLFQHFRLSSERRLPQLSAKAPMRYKTICFSSRGVRPLVSPLSHYRDCGTGCAVPMHPTKPKIERSCMKTLLLKKDEVRRLSV